MKNHLSLSALCLLAFAACDDSSQRKDPSTTGAVGPAPVVEQKHDPAVAPAPVAPARLTVLDKPASQWTVGGKSVSRATDEEMLAAAKKAGYVKDDTTMTPLLAGQYEARTFPIEKGKMKGEVKIVRPAATPGAPESASSMAAPSKLGASMNPESSAYVYDADGDVFVAVELSDGGKAADAKKVLDTLAVKSKEPIGEAQGAANGEKNATGTLGGAGNTKDSNVAPPTANGKANSEPRRPAKDSDSVPPK